MTTDQSHIARCFVPGHLPDPLAEAARLLQPAAFALIVLFVSPEMDLDRVAADVTRTFPGQMVIGCTTAGEIGGQGYESGGIVVLGFQRRHFAAQTLLIRDLSCMGANGPAGPLIEMRNRLAGNHPEFAQEFALLLVDGLSVKEDELAATLAAGASAMPVMGGSAGDGIRFRRTFVLYEGAFCMDAAVVAVLRTDCLVQSFCSDHLEPTDIRLVVTEAEPGIRLVRRLNGEIAAVEYARLAGLDPAQTEGVGQALRPLVVRIGQRHHVRAIQRCLPGGEMVFFSAVDEGVVLSLTRSLDLPTHLETVLERLSQPQAPVAILAFDCILRRSEMEQEQRVSVVSQLLARYGVVGFNTYGEQVGALHVNQTFSGYAFYPPAPRSAAAPPSSRLPGAAQEPDRIPGKTRDPASFRDADPPASPAQPVAPARPARSLTRSLARSLAQLPDQSLPQPQSLPQSQLPAQPQPPDQSRSADQSPDQALLRDLASAPDPRSAASPPAAPQTGVPQTGGPKPAGIGPGGIRPGGIRRDGNRPDGIRRGAAI